MPRDKFGPAERMLADPEKADFNVQIDALVKAGGVQVTTCIVIAQQISAETAFRARSLALDSAAGALARYATDGATVIRF
ncbi:MAG: hypothetical protein ACRCUE_03150 [Bosea sp. (in: a-proteobacteria)]